MDEITRIKEYIEQTEPCSLQDKYDVTIADVMALIEYAKEHPISGTTTAILYGMARGLNMGREESAGKGGKPLENL